MTVATYALRLARLPRAASLRIPQPWALVLAGIVLASFGVRIAVGWFRATPVFLADEYIYAELSRSLAESGRPLIRGADAGFPALLQPLLTAPAWLVDDVALAYRLVQTIGTLAMSLAAVPAFLLARRLALSRPLALGVGGLAVAVPDLLYASFVLAEPIAYPLVVAASAAAVAALARPRRSSQLAFVAFAVLAAFARAQFAVLPLCFLGATVLVGLRERALRSALRAQSLTFGLLILPALAVLAVGPGRVLGIYEGVLDAKLDALPLIERAGTNALVLLYASGWVLVPGALLGLALAFARPRSRAELAFAAFAPTLAGALFIQASLYGEVAQIQERYVFYVLPLAATAFALYTARGWPHRLVHAGAAAALVALSAQIPLAGYAAAAAHGQAHSPLLFGVFSLERAVGDAGTGSLLVAALAALLAVIAVLASLRPRLGTPLVLALAAAASTAAYAGAVHYDHRNAAAVRSAFLPEDRSWVDSPSLGTTALLLSHNGVRTDALQQLFWNRSVDRVLLLPGAHEIDFFDADRVRVADDGSLFAAGQPVRGPLLVDNYAATVELRGARRLASSATNTLWKPAGRPRLGLYVLGRYFDGWLAGAGSFNLWPASGQTLAGRLSLTLTSPPDAGTVRIAVTVPGEGRKDVVLAAGDAQTVRLPVCARGPWQAPFVSSVRGLVGGRVVSVRASKPVFRPDGAACRRRPTIAPAPDSPAAYA